MGTRTFRLRDLPDDMEALVCSVPTAARRLLKASSEPLLIPKEPPGQWLLLRRADFSWKLYLARHKKEVVFFFFREDSPAEVVLDTTVSLSVQAVIRAQEPAPFDESQIQYYVVVPPFVIRRPTPKQLADLAPDGATALDTVLFQVGPDREDVLAITDANSGTDRVKLRYRGGPEELRTPAGTWRLEPFLGLIRAIRSWVSGGFDQGQYVPMVIANDNVKSMPRSMLRLLTEAYISAQYGARPEPAPLSAILQPLQSDYEISDYQAKVLLRLTPDGEIAREHSDDPFQLLMNVVLTSEATHVRARVSVGPPDFVISGPLHQAFVESLREEKALDELSSLLSATKAEIKDSLSTSGEQCSIFRTKREEDYDTDIIVLPGMKSGKRTLSVVRGKFEVKAKKSPPVVTVKQDSLKKLFSGPLTTDARGVDDDMVEYFLRLVKALRNWIGVMP